MNIKKILSLICILLIAFACFNTEVLALTAREIIQKSDQAINGRSQVAIYEITIKTRRWKRTLELKSYQIRKQKKSFSEIYSPKKDAGNRFLLIDQNMWHYVPKLQQTIKISPSMMLQSWMGSDFTNDDIVKESSIVEDYVHSILGKETIDGHKCYKIQLKPKPGAVVVWGMIIYFARVSDFLPVKEEFYNEHGSLKKILTCSSFRKMHDRTIPTVYLMKTLKKKDRYTKMEIKKIRFDIKIPENIFSIQNLKRR